MFSVLSRKTGSNRLVSFVVSDRPEGWDDYNQQWPWVAEFNVSLRYSEEIQRSRAHEYCDYLNKHLVTIPPIGQ